MKKLFNILIKTKPRTIPVIYVLIIVTGLISLSFLNIEYLPDINYGETTVLVQASGLRPDEILREISKPLEDDFRTIKGVVGVYSNITRGNLKILIKTEKGINSDTVFSSISHICQVKYNRFPPNVSKPIVLKYSTDDMPVIVFSLPSDTNEEKADNLRQELSRIEGVSKVEISGIKTESYELIIDREKINVLNINLAQISDIITNFSDKITVNGENFIIVFDTPFTVKENLLNAPVKNLEGKAYFIKDFAELIKKTDTSSNKSRIDGKEKITGFVFKEANSNVEKITRKIEHFLTHLKEVDILYNQGEFIRDSIKSMFYAIMVGAIVSSVFMFLMLGKIKTVFPVIFSIPLNFLACFIFMYFRKITINVMSMSGFLFAFGMLYDNSVIVMEHLLRMKERKPDSGIYQIYKSVMKISSPILISTVTTFSVFIPVIFMRKDLYIMYKDFTEVLSFSLFLSFFSSIIIIPYFIYHFDFLKGKKTKKYKNYEYFNTYFIAKTLVYRKYIAVIFCLIIISGLISYIFTGNSSIGQTPDNTFILHCQPGLSTSAEKFTADMIKIEEYLVTHDEVEKIFSTKNDENYRVVIRVKKGKVRQFIKKYEEITDSLTLYPDVHVFLINAPGETFKNIDLLIYDKSYTERFRKAHIVYSTLSENLKNSQIVIKEKPPVDEMDIILSREKLISAGFSLKETAYILRAYLEGPKFDLGFDNKITETRMKLENITDVEEIKSLILRKLNFLTLKDISDIKLSRNPSVINTENGQPVTKIGIMWTGESESAVMKKITEILNELNSKRNQKIIWEFDESSRRIYEDRNEMTKTVLYTLILLTIILYMYYGSFKDVILVFSVIPFTYSVIIILMAVFKIPWSLPVYIAFLLLSGIIINNSILIIDLIEKDKSFSILFKIAHSINDKFRAIVITTATTALGIFPLVFAEGFWQIMGIISIAGLITGMLASLYLIPVLYYLTGEYFGKSNSA